MKQWFLYLEFVVVGGNLVGDTVAWSHDRSVDGNSLTELLLPRSAPLYILHVWDILEDAGARIINPLDGEDALEFTLNQHLGGLSL